MSKLIILAAPTGGGESTITKALLKNIPNSERFITTTSRAPRGKEENGVDYNFISTDDFKKKIAEGYFLEYTFVSNRNVYYGTPKEQIDKALAENKVMLFNYDIVGAKALKKYYGDKAISIFVKPESLDQIKNQLRGREPDMSPTELNSRLENARLEIKDSIFYDHVIINLPNQLDKSIADCLSILKK